MPPFTLSLSDLVWLYKQARSRTEAIINLNINSLELADLKVHKKLVDASFDRYLDLATQLLSLIHI